MDDTILTQEERATLDQFLSKPLNYPEEFKSWLPDYLSQNIPYIPVSQLLGYKGTLANNSIVNDAESVNSPEHTWTDLPSYGPSVTGLADGTYFVCWGGKTGRGASGGATNSIGPSVNNADPTGTNYATFAANDPDAPIWKSCIVIAKNNDVNEIRLKYYFDLGGGATAQFEQRWLTVIRIT